MVMLIELFFVTKKEVIVDGDYILAILAMHYKNKKKLFNNSIVSTKMSNLGMRKFFLKKN